LSGAVPGTPAHNGRVPGVLALLPRAVAALALLAACGGTAGESGSGPPAVPAPRRGPVTTTTTDPGPVPEGSVVVVAAGDIACTPGQAPSDLACRMQATADLVAAAEPAVVLTLGDNQYEDATLEKFRQSYDRSWGRFRSLTRPSPGNHDFGGGRGAGYFAYFGPAAGRPGQGWYGFDAGSWHVVALNSNCAALGGCGPGTPQYEWLRPDLAASDARCTLAYWHHPRFSSGYHGDDPSVGPLWELLAEAKAEVVLSGHDHHYERFAPLAPDGDPDPGGLRQFVVGTGGRSLYPTLLPRKGSERRQSTVFGVLVLTLSPDSYRWRFDSVAGVDSFTDAGHDACR